MKHALVLIPALVLLSACSGSPDESEPAPRSVVGGTLGDEQAFDVPAAEAWKAAEAALEGEELAVERRRRDDCGGKIVARREDGHRVTVTIHAPERAAAEVAVYVEPADRGLMEAVQRRIGEKLSLKRAQADLSGDTSVETSYEIDLDVGLEAAEQACRALAMDLTVRHREKERARLEAKDRDERRVRIVLHKAEGDASTTEIRLSTDATAAGGEKEFLRKVRRELEQHLFPATR